MSFLFRHAFKVAIFGSIAALLVGQVAEAAPVTIDVSNVKTAKGRIRAAICTRAKFLSESCEFDADAPAVVGVTSVTFPDIPPGAYAAQVFQDEHDDGTVHRDALGIPTEGVGFSRDAALHLKGPRFNEATFQVGEQPVRMKIRLRHLPH